MNHEGCWNILIIGLGIVLILALAYGAIPLLLMLGWNLLLVPAGIFGITTPIVFWQALLGWVCITIILSALKWCLSSKE